VTVKPLLPLFPSKVIVTVEIDGFGLAPAKKAALVGLVIVRFDAPAAKLVLELIVMLFCKNKGFVKLMVEFAGRLNPI